MIFGYIRVSKGDQNTYLQIDALSNAGCDKTFTDKVSGSKASRPELDKMKTMLREGDTLVIWKLARLGRSSKNLLEWMEFLRANKITLVSITEGLDTSTIAGRLIYAMMAALAEADRETIVENTRAGLAAAKSRGRLGGRPKGLSEDKLQVAKTAKDLYDTGKYSIGEVAKRLSLPIATCYRYINFVSEKIPA